MATRQKWDSESERMARSIDALSEYDEFCHVLLSKLQRMILEDWPPEKIRQEFASLAQAQTISKALQGDVRALKDVLDQHEGASVKRRKVAHQYASMSKAELAALAYRKLIDCGLIA